MQKTVKALLNVFKTLNYDAYYVGERCRNEVYNEIIKAKKVRPSKSIIATNATVEQIKHIFPTIKQDEKNKMVFYLDFGNDSLIIESFHVQKYYISEENKFLDIPIVIHVNTLEEDFLRRTFTINCVAKDYENKTIFYSSSEEDLTNNEIQTLNNAKDSLHEYPIRCLEIFSLMSQTGFSINEALLKQIKTNMKYLKYMPAHLVGIELRKIMQGKNVLETLRLMHSIGIFHAKCHLDGKLNRILESLHNAHINIFDIIQKFKITKDIELELWSLLFENADIAKQELMKYDSFSDKDVNTVIWLMNNKNLINEKDIIQLRQKIYDSLHEIENREGIHYLKELIVHLNHIYETINETDSDDEKTDNVNRILFQLCCRPYFYNQITWNISDERRKELIPKLIRCIKYPVMTDEIEEFLQNN